MLRRLFPLAVLGLLCASVAQAAVPTVLAVQGRLTSVAGIAAPDGKYPLVIRIYDAPDAKQAVFEEVFLGVPVESGAFAIEIGATPKYPLDGALLAVGTPAVGIQVGDDPELPRQPIRPVPQAVAAALAQDLACSACVGTADVAAGAITADKMAADVLQPYAKSADLSTVATTGAYADLKGTPDFAPYAKKSELAGVATSGAYADLAGLPNLAGLVHAVDLATVATSGAYDDLKGKPDLGAFATIAALAKVAFSGKYVDLAGTPDLSVYAKLGSINAFTQQNTFAGNVGIGTALPAGRLDVHAAGPAVPTTKGSKVTASYSPSFGSPAVLTDGAYASEGTSFDNATYAVSLNAAGPSSSLTVDLGQVYTTIAAIKVQCDNNDTYQVDVSADGSTWTPAYSVALASGGGLRTRTSPAFGPLAGRYLRVYATGGDGLYSCSEIEVDPGVTSIDGSLVVKDGAGVGIGTANPKYLLQVNGSFGAILKNFDIPHPLDPTRRLVHSVVEGPEASVSYRGRAELTAGRAVVLLPKYFEALTRPEGRTVQLTCDGGWSPLYVASPIARGQFAVQVAPGGTPNQAFFWEVRAVRADVPPLVVEP